MGWDRGWDVAKGFHDVIISRYGRPVFLCQVALPRSINSIERFVFFIINELVLSQTPFYLG
jgi:hypothetical protein